MTPLTKDTLPNWEKVLLANGFTPQDIIKITNELIGFYKAANLRRTGTWNDIFLQYNSIPFSIRPDLTTWLRNHFNPPIPLPDEKSKEKETLPKNH